MKHLSVGSAPSFDISRLRGAAELARQDAERSEWLAKRCREVTKEDRLDPMVCACGSELHENAKKLKCSRCLKTEWMRQARRKARMVEEDDHRGQTVAMTTCTVCGVEIRKWGPNGNRRRCCDACVDVAKRRRHINVEVA